MTERQLHAMLEGLDGSGGWIIRAVEAAAPSPAEVLLASWRTAAAEAKTAYEEWRRSQTASSYAVYRACADRADASQDALERASRSGG